MSKEFTITEENGNFIYREEVLNIRLYGDGIAIHGARDTFSGETLSVLFGPDVATALHRLFTHPDVVKQLKKNLPAE
jgi:hypothetical protein